MRFFLLILMSFTFEHFFAQSLTGVVLLTDGAAAEGAVLLDNQSGKWTTANALGEFSLPVSEHYKVEVSLLGMQSVVLTPDSFPPSKRIILQEKTLYLSDVELTATQKSNDKTNSALLLNKYAISQFQAFSLADVLKQLPGQTITTPTFDHPVQLNLRTAVRANKNTPQGQNNAFGVSFIIDGQPLSNDENMQTYYNSSKGTSRYSTANKGIDLRDIPISSVEKIEVIMGVPDASYGNLSSGAVVVERKAGVYPLQVSASMLSGGNNLSIAKGFELGQRWGQLSLTADYLDANTDPRLTLSRYKRLSLSPTWSYYTPDSKWRNTLSLTLKGNLSQYTSDAELSEHYQQVALKEYRSIQMSNRMELQLSKAYLDRIKLNASFSYAKDEDKYWFFVNNGARVVPSAVVTSIASGRYTPVAYRSLRHTLGKPLNVQLQLQAEKNLLFPRLTQALSVGASINYSNNLGAGTIADETTIGNSATLSAAESSGGGFRPLNFNKIVIPSVLFALYVQDKITLRTTQTQSLHTNLGLRYELDNGFGSLSPRVNTAYELHPNFKLRAGVGMVAKAPSLAMRFPGNIYTDKLLTDLRTPYYSFNLIQTIVTPREKVVLSPSYTWKWEAGADLHLPNFSLSLTTYHNRTREQFAHRQKWHSVQVPVVEVATSPDGREVKGYHIKGYRRESFSYTQPVNNGTNTDKGIELTCHLPKLTAIGLKPSLVASYVHTTHQYTLLEEVRTHDATEQRYFIGTHTPRVSFDDQMQLLLTLSYHLPRLGLLTTISVEQFVFFREGQEQADAYPIYYQDKQLERHTVSPADVSQRAFAGISRVKPERYLVRTPLYHNFHLRLTKEMASGLSLSLYVVNFLNHRPETTLSDGRNVYQNKEISFGGSVKYVFKQRR